MAVLTWTKTLTLLVEKLCTQLRAAEHRVAECFTSESDHHREMVFLDADAFCSFGMETPLTR